ncbi:MFS transporter [Paracoccus luteus]|uniref:MFS transporter n=1 Tax=Paracoccus luteus TaxID=2508543 RepID=UPI00106FD0CC|nr:MFS transporter [Paracoccus luteus]
MNRRRIWGWWFFDWASQPYHTLLLTFIFSIYFAEVAQHRFAMLGAADAVHAGAQAQATWGYALSLSGVVIAVLAPVLGAVADTTGRRMPWIWLFSALYVVGSAGLWFLTPDGSALMQTLVLFGIGLIGLEFATIFTNALMPTLAGRDEMGRISGSGFAFGYLGGVMALVAMLALFAESRTTGLTLLGNPPALGLDAAAREGTRFVGPFTAIWYVVFMIPFFLWVREPRGAGRPLEPGRVAGELWRMIRSLRHRRSLAAWLVSSMLSRDALNALYAFGGIYAATVLGWPVIWSGVFGVVSALAAAVISWLGGRADRRWGPKPVIVTCTVVLILVCLVIVGMSRQSFFGLPLAAGSRLPDALFLGCGVAIGGAGGALQSACRTMMVRHTTAARATEAFGLYALSGKATAFLSPFLIAVATDLSGNQRIGISPLIVMFLLSLALLSWVNPEGEPEQ